MFDDRRTWVDHEMQNHWRTFICQLCGMSGWANIDELTTHVHQRHPDLNDTEKSTFVEASSRPLEKISTEACTLCNWTAKFHTSDSSLVEGQAVFAEPRRLMRHLARHLEQVALFSLPRPTGADGQTDQAKAGDIASKGSIRSLVSFIGDRKVPSVAYEV
jgi:hypothetical protein